MKQLKLGDILKVLILKDEVFIKVEGYGSTGQVHVPIGWMYRPITDAEPQEEIFLMVDAFVEYHAHNDEGMYFQLVSSQ